MSSTSLPSKARRWRVQAALLALGLIALGLRVWRLHELPAGLHFDEAAHGLLVQGTIFRGQTPVFFSAYTGHEALFHYTVAPFLAALGPTILALRLPAALWSVALVPVVYFLGTRLWSWRAGLLAAIAVACGSWLVHVGRIGFRANTLPMVSGLAVLLLYQALTMQRRRDWLLSGALFGLSLYTYLAVRLLPLLAPLLLIYLAMWHRPLLRRSAAGLALFSLALLVVSTPFIYHMVRVPSDFWERFEQIAVTEAQPGTQSLLLHNMGATLRMFGLRGARDVFFNLPYRPVFPGIAAVPFYAGVLVALLRWRQLAHALVLLWLGVMLLPTILAADAPHWLRAIGAAPAVYLLWGHGAAALWQALERVMALRRLSNGPVVGVLVFSLLIGWWTQATAREYFGMWARQPELYYSYMQYATDAARAAEAVPPEQTLLISEEYYRHATYLYLAPRSRTGQWFDARSAVVWPRTAPWTAIISASTPTTADIQPLLAQARGQPFTPDGLFAYMRLQGDTLPPFTPPTLLGARFGTAVELQGMDVSGSFAPNTTLHVQLFNRVLQPPGRELRFFVHLEDEQYRVVAQQDALGYDAREWQPGDQFISFHDLQLPATLPAGNLRLVVGLYDVITGARLPASGSGAHGDFVELLASPAQQ